MLALTKWLICACGGKQMPPYFLNSVHRKSVDIAQTYIICLFQVHFYNSYACYLVFESGFSERYLAKKLDSVAFFLAKNAPKSHLSGDIATILLLVIFPVQAPNFLIPRDSSRIYSHEKPKIWDYVKEIIHCKEYFVSTIAYL